MIDGSRDEEDIKPPVNPDCGFVELANGHLRTFRIAGYGDGDEDCPVVRGNGSLTAGSIVSGGSGINLTLGTITDVDIRTGGLVNLAVQGDVLRSAYHGHDLGTIDVSGQLELEDGRGGVLIGVFPLFVKGARATFTFPAGAAELSGLYEASFAGDRLLLHSSVAGGVRKTSVIAYHDQARLSGNAGTGSVALEGDGAIVATMRGTGGRFEVRRLAG